MGLRGKEIIELFSEGIVRSVGCKLGEKYGEDTLKQIARYTDGFIGDLYRGRSSSDKIGKGRVFIARYTAKALYGLIGGGMNPDVIKNLYTIGKRSNFDNFPFVVPFIITEYCSAEFPEDELMEIIINYAVSDNWELRELAVHPIRTIFRKYPDRTYALLTDWVTSDNPLLRRAAVESLRPVGPNRRVISGVYLDYIFTLLKMLGPEPSEYVAKSAGNVIKDLSKYIPKIILDKVRNWLREENIRLPLDAISDKKRYRLFRIIGFGLRWLKDRAPEYHGEIAEILGENYVKYYDEKKNRRAVPR